MTPPSHDVLIIGAGLSGLGVAAFLHDKRPDIRFLVLEKEDRPGGAIASHSEEGFLAEAGPHGFLDNCLESRVLIGLAGIGKEVEKAPLKRFVRYICLDGHLDLIPQEPLRILRAPLISWPAKLRILADLWKKPLGGEPSVEEWVRHRFGAALLPFADAVFTGTYAGDIGRLRIDAVMAGVRDLEREHGSVIRGLWKRQREKRKEGKAKRSGLPAMTSFASGMVRLPQGLAARLQVNREIMYNTEVRELVREEGSWRVLTRRNEFTARHLVLALPVNAALALLAGVGDLAPPPMARIPEARIATVALGFSGAAKIPFGFGYLAPESEHRFALGALFSSHMFPGRAPMGHQLLEALVGGRRHPERLELTDGELIERVHDDLRQLMELPEAPGYARVLRPGAGIPQLEEGYPALLAWRNALEADTGNLHICGFGWKGIGINDMTKEAWKVARRILSQRLEEEENQVKGIYF